MHIQDLIKEAQREAKAGGMEITLTLEPYAEHEGDQLGYCPTMALELFKYSIPVGTVSPDGTVKLNNGVK